MRILLIHRHYWPDIPTDARVLHLIATRLASDGHSVTVICGQPAFNDVQQPRCRWCDVVNGVRIRRIPLLLEKKHLRALRVLNFVLFLSCAIVYGRIIGRPELVVTVSTPPVLSGVCAQLLCLGSRRRFVYFCQDLHPECSIISNQLRSTSLRRVLSLAENHSRRKAAAVVCLSRDMADSISLSGVHASRIRIINNCYLGENSAQLADRPCEERFEVLFAGNMGEYQDLEYLVDAAHLLRDDNNIHITFMGSGSAMTRLIQRADSLIGGRVTFEPHKTFEAAFRRMCKADLGVISLRPGVYRYAYPSKTMAYLAAGCPLLGIIEPNSELGLSILERNLGYLSKQRDPHGIADAIRVANRNRSYWCNERDRIREFANGLFNKRRMLHEWCELVKSLAAADKVSAIN